MKSLTGETRASAGSANIDGAIRLLWDRAKERYSDLMAELVTVQHQGKDGWTLRIQVGGRSIEAVRDAGGAVMPLVTAAAPLGAEDAVRISEAVRLQPEPPAATVIGIDPALASIKTLQLPTREATYIRAILRNRVERLGPWRAARALFGYSVEEWSDTSRQAQIRVAVVSRATVEELTSALAEAGVAVDRVDVDSGGQTVSILSSPSARERRRGRRTAIGYVSAIGLLVVALTATTVVNSFLLRQLEALQQEIGTDIASMDGSTAPVTGRSLVARKAHEYLRVRVLSEISRLLPDNAWLTSLKVTENAIEVTGKSRDVPAIISALQPSRLLDDVRFSAPTVHVQGDEAGEFSIAASIRAQQGFAP